MAALRVVAVVAIALICGSGILPAQSSTGQLHDPRIEKQIDALLRQMTLEEKAGQLNQFSFGMPTGPGTGRTGYAEMIAKGQIGSILNLAGAKETNAIQRVAMEQSRLRIPVVFALDVIHGYRTTFPTPLALATTWDMDLIERSARIAAQEAAAAGVRWTFSPMLDIARDPRWGRIVEGGGEDPYLTSAVARAFVRGYQGKKLSDAGSILACAKHYAGYGAAEGGRDYNTAEISERTLRQTYLPPFKAAVDAGAATVMSAFNTIDAVPASANPFTLTQVLRKEWGFAGAIVSDWGSIGELIAHGVALDGRTAALKGFTAGVDVDMESNLYGPLLPELVKTGKVSMSSVDEAVRRILRVKFALGLFEHPYVEESTAPPAPISTEQLAVAREAAEKSFVLLKNAPLDSGTPILPLEHALPTVAVVGPFADNAVEMLGSWPGKGDSADVTTLVAELKGRFAKTGQQMLYAQGTEILGQTDVGFAAAISAAQQADVVLMALGEKASLMTGEAASRASLRLPGNQQQLLEAVIKTGKPVVLLLFTGRPLALDWAAQNVPAILQVWHPGVQAGPALARVLFGETSPSGKLTVSFPRSEGQIPVHYNHLNTGRPAVGIDLTRPPAGGNEKYKSRYVDERNDPLFPFAHGLSYTTFEYTAPKLSATSASAKQWNSGAGRVRVSATVRNTGTRRADEIVQLYIRQRGTSVALPVRELKGFRRVTLGAGESKEIEFELGREELAFWDLQMNDVVEPAEVTVWISGSSATGSEGTFRITEQEQN